MCRILTQEGEKGRQNLKRADSLNKTGKREEERTSRREGGDEFSRLTRHRGRACLISARRRRCGASAFGLSALSLHPFSKRLEHPVINNGAFWKLRSHGEVITVIVSYARPRARIGARTSARHVPKLTMMTTIKNNPLSDFLIRYL